MSAETVDHVAMPQLREATPAAYVPIDMCGCGHERDAHEHHRLGKDCGVCGPARCRRYRRRTGRGARSAFRRFVTR